MLYLRGEQERRPSEHRSVHAVQQVGVQAAVPRDVRSVARAPLRGGGQLPGQRQVLRVLPPPLHQTGQYLKEVGCW